MKILIIDDEEHIRQLMRLTLEASGYQVEEAGSGEDGLALFKDGRGFDAVLLDQKLPGLDGLHTLVELLKRNRQARVVMVTAFASVELAVDAMKLGTTDFLRKPMTPDSLRAAVAAAVASAPHRTDQQRGVEPGRIEVLTLNGFRLSWRNATAPPAAPGHLFEITHYPDGSSSQVLVAIAAEAVGRVTRLTGRSLNPSGAFWRDQAQRLLASILWTEGAPPPNGQLTVSDVSREALEVAAAWRSG